MNYINAKSPLLAGTDVQLSTEDGIAYITGRGGIATLDKTVVYNTAGNALEVSSLENMVAAYPVLYDAFDNGLINEAVMEAFTVTSDAYTSNLVTPLDGVAISGGNIILTAAGTAAPKLALGSSTVDINNVNIAVGATAALTNSDHASYTLVPAPATPALSGNVVSVELEIPGATVTTTPTGITVTGLSGLSTLKATLTDATGLVYTSSVRIEPLR